MAKVSGAKILQGRGAVAVLDCGCVDAQHHPGNVYYTSARNDRGAYVALSGPYRTHTEALAAVSADKAWAWEYDARAPWYAYGTMTAPLGTVRTVRP